MRIAESHLRRIIADEAKKFKRNRGLNESFYQPLAAEESLGEALMAYVEEAMDREGMTGDEACADLQRFVASWCSEMSATF